MNGPELRWVADDAERILTACSGGGQRRGRRLSSMFCGLVLAGFMPMISSCETSPTYHEGDCVYVQRNDNATYRHAKAEKVDCGAANYKVIKYIDNESHETCTGVPGLKATYFESSRYSGFTLCLGET